MIPTTPEAIKKAQEQAARNIERGDWEDDFGLPDRYSPKSAISSLLTKIGNVTLPKK